eukprot:g1958.t1
MFILQFTADAAGLAKLNGVLSSKSYIEGFSFSDADSAVFATATGAPDADKFPHAFRWYIHIAALTGLGSFTPAAAAAPAAPAAKKAAKKPAADDDDDMDDLFGDDDEEEAAGDAGMSRAEKAKAAKAAKDAETQRKKEEALARLAKKEAKQRSLCNLEIKPWEAEQ